MAGHGLRGTHGQPVSVRPEEAPDGLRLHDVIGLRGGAVRVDIIHFLRIDAGVAESLLHRTEVADAVRVWGDRMIGLATASLAEDFGIDARIAAERMRQLL